MTNRYTETVESLGKEVYLELIKAAAYNITNVNVNYTGVPMLEQNQLLFDRIVELAHSAAISYVQQFEIPEDETERKESSAV